MCKTDYGRQIIKISDVATKVATVPSTDDHSDGSWLDTDIYEGEFFINTTDGILQTRDSAGILTINTSGSVSDNSLLLENRISSNYTLVLTDKSKVITMETAIANTITVPLNSSVAFPIGTQILLSKEGSGNLNIAGSVGVFFVGSLGTAVSNGETGSIVKIGTNTWKKIGINN